MNVAQAGPYLSWVSVGQATTIIQQCPLDAHLASRRMANVITPQLS